MTEMSVRDLIAQGFHSQTQDINAPNDNKSLPPNRPSTPKILSVRDLIQEGFQSSKEEKPFIAPRGPIDETVSALGAGFAQTGQAIGGTMEMLGVPGGQKIREEWQAIGELPSLQRPTYLQQDDKIRGGDWRWWVRNVGENIPNFAMMYGVGGAAGTVAKIAGAGIKAISRAALAGGFGGSFTMEAGSQYAQAKSEMLEEGYTDPDEIERVATMEGLVAGTVNAIIEMIPMENVFGRTPVAQHILKRILKQGILEGSTESIQEGVNIFAEKIGHKPDQQWSDQVNRILTSGIVGGVLGGGIAGPMGATAHKQQVKQYNALADQYDLKDNIYQWKDAGISDQEIATRVTDRLQKIQEANTQFNQSLQDQAADKKADPLPQVPEIDSREMVDYVLYAEGKYTPPAAPVSQVAKSAKEKVLSAFGMKSSAAKPQSAPVEPEAGMTVNSVETTDLGQAQQNQMRQAEDQKKAARAQGEGLFDKVLTDLTAEGQQQIEAARLAEDQAREEEQARLAEAEAQKVAAAVAAADQQQAQVKSALAADDSRKQAIVDEVMGLSDKRLFTAAQAEAGWNIVPDGRGSYALETPQGNVPVNLMQIREQLAARRIADYDAKMAKQQADEEATQRMEAEAAERRARKLEKKRIEYLRKSLQGMSLTQGQVDSLEQMRDQLTPDEIRRLDLHKRDLAQKEAAKAFEAKAPAAPIQPEAVLEEKPNPEKATTEQDAAAQETALIDAMLIELDGAARGGLLLEDETTGEKTRTGTGIGWLSAANQKGWGIGTADARTILEKAREGKPLTERQQNIYNDLTRQAQQSAPGDLAEELLWVGKGFQPLRAGKVSVDEMTAGDAFVIGGEEYKVSDIDEDGNVTLKDGTIKKVKAGTELSGVDYVKIDQEAVSFDPDQLTDEEQQPAALAPKSGTMEDKGPAEIVESAATSQAEKTGETAKNPVTQGARSLGARPEVEIESKRQARIDYDRSESKRNIKLLIKKIKELPYKKRASVVAGDYYDSVKNFVNDLRKEGGVDEDTISVLVNSGLYDDAYLKEIIPEHQPPAKQQGAKSLGVRPAAAPAETSGRQMYRGSGRENEAAVYNDLTDQKALLGDGQFWALSEKDAKTYGPNVESKPIPEFSKPLIVKDDYAWQSLIKKAVGKYDSADERISYPNPFGLPKEQMDLWRKGVSDYLRENGHDALIINMDGARGDDAKTLYNAFGHSQIFIPAAQAAQAPAQLSKPPEDSISGKVEAAGASPEVTVPQGARSLGAKPALQSAAPAETSKEGVFTNHGNPYNLAFEPGKSYDITYRSDGGQVRKFKGYIFKEDEDYGKAQNWKFTHPTKGNLESFSKSSIIAAGENQQSTQGAKSLGARPKGAKTHAWEIKKQFEEDNRKTFESLSYVGDLIKREELQGDWIRLTYADKPTRNAVTVDVIESMGSAANRFENGDVVSYKNKLWSVAGRHVNRITIQEQGNKDQMLIVDPRHLTLLPKASLKPATAEAAAAKNAPRGAFPAPEKTVRADSAAKESGERLTQRQADQRLQEWKKETERVKNEEDHSKEVILSLFDRTGVWSRPYAESGYTVITYDATTGEDIFRDNPLAIVETLENQGWNVTGILSAPPCTSFSASGARWWENQHDIDNPDKVEELYGKAAAQLYDKPIDAAEALAGITGVIVDIARERGHDLQFYALENPVGRIADRAELPDPALTFHPNNYGDPYTKKTMLWGEFNPDLPQANVEPHEGSRIHALRGNVPEQKSKRSETPEGFAYAFFMANHAKPTGAGLKQAPAEAAVPAAAPLEAQSKEYIEAQPKTDESINIQDTGEKLGGARKDRAAFFKKEYTDDDIASLPLSKIWPKNEADTIEDPFVAAFSFAARDAIPTKPQKKHKVARWVDTVKNFRGMMSELFKDIETGKHSREKMLERGRERQGLKGFFAKVRLLEAVDREQWARIGEVREHPDAYRYGDKMGEDGKYERIPSPSVSVHIDGHYKSFEGAKTIEEVIGQIKEALDKAPPTQADSIKSFEVRGSKGRYFINKKGDSQYHKLKEFTSAEEALNYRNENVDELWKAWDAVKELENVAKEDVRNKDNRPRTGKDHRGGKDVSAQQFIDAFGFRGVEFGNWVNQGKNAQERQGMLNEAYDAMMDLADILGVPPKAISLNGTLGLGFGSRGQGWAAAHYEPDTIVINLTKTKGSGTFAHEFFHALDNYFQRKRGVEGRGREKTYITYNPETYYQDKSGFRLSEARYNEMLQKNRLNPTNWTKIDGVRPAVAEAFKTLVDALDASPMSERVSHIKNKYWSRIIERAARSFENYVIVKMAKQGYQNDYLANVVRLEDFKRMAGRYPYLMDEEIAPIEEAFDNLFETIQTRKTDKGVEMYSRGENNAGQHLTKDELEQHAKQLMGGNKNQPALVVVEKASELPFDAADDTKGVYHDGTMYLVAEQIAFPEDANEVVFHEFVGHFGLRGFFGSIIDMALLDIHEKNPLVRKYAAAWKADNLDFKKQHGLSDSEYYYRSIEEAMAKMAQENKPFTFAKRLLSTVQSLLRKIGLNILADSLEAKTNAEALTMLHKAKLYIHQDKTINSKIPAPLYPYFMRASDATEDKGAATQPAKEIGEKAKAPESIGKKAEVVFAERITKPLGNLVSQGVRSLTGKAAPETQESMVRAFNQWREFWNPGATLPNADAWKAARAKGMGDVAAAMRFIEELQRKLDILPPDLKKSMFQVLDGAIPLNTLPEEIVVQVPADQGRIANARRAATKYAGFEMKDEPHVPQTVHPRELARLIRHRSDTIGEMMNDRGLITDKQLAAHKGKYIHYAYAYHVLGDDAPIGITPSGKMDLSETLGRNPNLTPAQRREMGLIEDASIAVPLGMGKALTDVSKYDYLNKIAENPDWVWQPSIVTLPLGAPMKTPVKGRSRQFIKMTVGKLVEETKKYAEMVAKSPSPEVEEHYRILKDALDRAQAESKNVPADFVQLPNSRGFGPLAGAFVRQTIADDITPIMGQINESMGSAARTILEIEAKAMSAFKMGKVALNIPTMARNVFSNIIQVNLSGRSLKQIFQPNGDLQKGAQSLLDKDQYYEEAFRMGIFNTNWAAAEVNAVLDEFRKAESGRIDKLLMLAKKLAQFYGKIDDFFKLSLFRAMREEGKSIDEAAVHALKWGMDYSLASRSIKTARRHFLPFISYQYKIAPLIAESLKTRPWVLAKYALLFPMAQMLAQSLFDMDDDEWEDLKKQLPDYIKKSGSMMILPWKSEKGNWQFVNAEYFLPWGNWFNIFRDMTSGDIGEFTRDLGVSHPLLDILTTFRATRDGTPPAHPFFGQPIYNELDHPMLKAAKMTEHLAFTFLPTMLSPSKGALGSLYDAAVGSEDRWGKKVTAPQAVVRWFGVNVITVSPEQSEAIVRVKTQELKKELSRIDNDPSISESRKEAARQRYRDDMAELAETAPTAVLPIRKQPGNDPVFNALVEMVEAGTLHSGSPSRTVEIGGIPYKMTIEQYREYVDKSSELARRKLQPLMESAAWETMTDKRKSDVVSAIVTNARKNARQKVKAEIARAHREKLITARRNAPAPT